MLDDSNIGKGDTSCAPVWLRNKIRTKEGIAEPMPLSDIQENNRLLRVIVWLGIWIVFTLVCICIFLIVKYPIFARLVNHLISLG